MSDARYRTKRWLRRRGAQLRAEPLCSFCLAAGRTMAATVADHVIPHRGDAELFWHGKLQSLCANCHNVHKQREEARGFSDQLDADGWPTDPRHLANAPQQPPQARARPPPGGAKSLRRSRR
jgi:5-methylcytosine-specific restriction enzyme A